MKRGPRKYRRIAYLNLKRKMEQTSTAKFPSLAELSKEINVPGWQVENDDKYRVSFFRREKNEFQGQRITLELQVQSSQQQPLATKVILKSHNCITNLSALLKIPQVIPPYAWREKIVYFLEYLNGSNLCSGMPLEEDGETVALIPHITGKWNDLMDPGTKPERGSFAASCQIITHGKKLSCSRCAYLKKVNCDRKTRKESRAEVKPFCNKRYLLREELVELCQNETKRRRNAEMRVEYWQNKFRSEALEMDDQDQSDLVSIFENTNSSDVPSDMACL